MTAIAQSPFDRLYADPTYLSRRAHQIASAVFLDSCSKLDLTPSQYCVLFILRHRSPVGQNELGRYAHLDRGTTSVVVRILQARQLVVASLDDRDKRKRLLALTKQGRLLIGRADRLCTCAGREFLSVFDKDQARVFMDLLALLATAHEARLGSKETIE
jgi:DNA-binding MarR family transcriptional regulator